ncbi:hypothetical protein [Rhodococcus sp. PSBB049]|uniref:hypothetical protein n=1 Tax=Rhodococcus sp. PSBB049 TaxID=2812863 RepID=UPI00197D2857|nr:hypothetical protein [Rhodococcus sp. PSBB049]QSE72368.1 hypothetical protein JYA91_28935 [Rhodococcus sp. PSBB049]
MVELDEPLPYDIMLGGVDGTYREEWLDYGGSGGSRSRSSAARVRLGGDHVGSVVSYLDSTRTTDDAAETEAIGVASDGFTVLAALAVIGIALLVYLRRRNSPEHTLPSRSALRRAAISAGALVAALSVSRVISRGTSSAAGRAVGETLWDEVNRQVKSLLVGAILAIRSGAVPA